MFATHKSRRTIRPNSKASTPRSFRSALALAAIGLPLVGFGAVAWADETHGAPSDGPSTRGPRSRLTLTGEWNVETTTQKNFDLGRTTDTAAPGSASDFDAFWQQELKLYPRLILSDNLNINLGWTLGQGVWGLDLDPNSGSGLSGLSHKGTFVPFHLNWAFLAYRHAPTKTRWYIGRQRWSLGHKLVLDTNGDGLQIHRELPGLASNLILGFAKMSEGTDGLTDQNRTPQLGADGRDADLWFLNWDYRPASGGFAFSPFFVSYVDRGNADGITLFPDGLDDVSARFRPQISSAKAFGASLALQRGVLHLDAEFDQLTGTDRVKNANSGQFEMHDVNNGDLKGSNLYARLALAGSRIELGGTFAQGSGDDDPRAGEGNINSIRETGWFYITEVWEDTVALDEDGVAPGGLGSPFVRGYRGLENTRILQGHAALQASQRLRVTGTFSLIRASKGIRSWADANGDGAIDASEFGSRVSTELGSEIDGRFDWHLDHDATLSLRGGMFFPREAAGWLVHGTSKYQEKVREIRLHLTVPIPEFSLGG
ncbi:MAG: hypothetical protein U0527_12690 [Candidatus Eisenbacteria bacterium]